jgi:5-methylcytosine-specific restriction protein A
MTHSTIEELKPKSNHRVMDLVERAGVDVSDWANFEGGAARAASNPKYCYEWAFIEPSKLILLNLWHEALIGENGTIYQELNYRRWATELASQGKHSTWERRARFLDKACQTAWREKLPVRVVICDGTTRGKDSDEASEVKARELDSTPWAITEYNWETGDCRVTRGASSNQFADQFSQELLSAAEVQKRATSGSVFVRSAGVRAAVLQRSVGKCEHCETPGFQMQDGRVFLETHHIVPLFEGGADHVLNVIALCPNHHREAHHGVAKADLQSHFQKLVSGKMGIANAEA